MSNCSTSSRVDPACMSIALTTPRRVAIIGGGPAGLMAAETVRAAGHAVDLYEAKGSPGRKFLIAGKG
ncbi:NAD(P)-binding protein, partial [Streptococcus suis]